RDESPFEFGSTGGGSFGSIAIGERAQPGMENRYVRLPETIRLQEIMNMPPISGEEVHSPEAVQRVRRRMMRELAAPLGPNWWVGGIDASLTMEELCEILESGLDRPLIDETSLPGAYAIRIHTEATTTEAFLRV